MNVLYTPIDSLIERKMKEIEERYDQKMAKVREKKAAAADVNPDNDKLEYNVKKVVAKIEEETNMRKKKSKAKKIGADADADPPPQPI